MAKKKVESRISPPIVVPTVGVTYESLDEGEAFIYKNKLYLKVDVGDQEGIRLDESGEYDYSMCDNVVLPVDIKITWKEKK